MIEVLITSSIIALVAIAGYLDLRERRVPNWTAVSIFALGMLRHVFLLDRKGLLGGLFLTAIVFVLFIPFWKAGGLGGGDVKFLMALAMWLPLPEYLLVILLASGLLLVVVLLRMLLEKRFLPFIMGFFLRLNIGLGHFLETADKSLGMPYATFLALAVTMVKLGGELL